MRLLLHVARHASLSGAAKELGLNVSTCSRRLARLEVALGTTCFVRRSDGMELTNAGRLVLERADAIERQFVSLTRELALRTPLSAAHVTVTCPDSLGSSFVAPALASLLRRHAQLSIDLITDNRTLDLHRREADLALRLRRPSEGGLKIRKIAEAHYGLYASTRYLEAFGHPQTVADLRRHHLIGFKSAYPDHPPAAWWGEQCAKGITSLRTDRTLDKLKCAEGDLGVTILPLLMGAESTLVRVLPDVDVPTLEVFLVAEPGTLRVPAIKQVADHLATEAKRMRPLFEGLH